MSAPCFGAVPFILAKLIAQDFLHTTITIKVDKCSNKYLVVRSLGRRAIHSLIHEP